MPSAAPWIARSSSASSSALRAAALLLLLASCAKSSSEGETHFVTDDIVGGSRLRAIWLGSSEGALRASGFHDTERDEDCDFALAGDGVWRCLPRGSHFETGNVYSDVYSDATCTLPVYPVTSDTCGLPSLLQRDDGSTCPVTRKIFALGAEIGAGAPLYSFASGSCREKTTRAARNFAVGSEVDYALFVAAAPVRGPTAGGLAEEYLAGEDGSRSFTVLWDDAGGIRCSPQIAGDLAWRCVPETDAYVSSFLKADAGCTEDAATAYGSTGTCVFDHAYASGEQDASCNFPHRIFQISEEVDAVWSDPSACSPYTGGPPGYRFFRLGPEIPPDTFIQGEARRAPGRLSRLEVEFPGGIGYRTWDVADSVLGAASLMPVAAADGVDRWLPIMGAAALFPFFPYFADEACTEPLATAFASGECVPRFSYDYGLDTCPTHFHVYQLGEPFAGQLYEDWGSGCSATTASAGPTFYRIGAEVPPDSFVPVVRELR